VSNETFQTQYGSMISIA